MSGSSSRRVGKHHQPVVADNLSRTLCRWCQSKFAVAESDARSFCPQCAHLGWKLNHLTTWRKAIRDGVRTRLTDAAANAWLRELPPDKCEVEALPEYEDFAKEPETLAMWRKWPKCPNAL